MYTLLTHAVGLSPAFTRTYTETFRTVRFRSQNTENTTRLHYPDRCLMLFGEQPLLTVEHKVRKSVACAKRGDASMLKRPICTVTDVLQRAMCVTTH
jgi:hypothetical protein